MGEHEAGELKGPGPMKEPMITGEMKLWYTLGGVLVGTAVVYGWITAGIDWSHLGSNPGQLVGALSLGYKGPVGDHTGYGLLLGAGIAGLLLGTAMGFARRDRDEVGGGEGKLEEMPAGERALAAPVRLTAAGRVPWPLLVSVSLAVVAVGIALDRFLMMLGFGLLAAAGVGWWETSAPADRPGREPSAVDPLVAWIGSSARGRLAVRAATLAFTLFGVYVLFSSFATRSGTALLGIVLLGLAVVMASWVELQFDDQRGAGRS